MEQLKYMFIIILAVLAIIASYYVVIVVVLAIAAFVISKSFVNVKKVWNGN